MRRFLAITVLALLGAAPTQAKVTVLNENGDTLDTFTKLGCRASGKKGSQDFFAAGKSVDGKYNLSVFIDEPVFTGFGEDYTIYYGGSDPQYFLRRYADDEVFSNFRLAGTPPNTLGAGAIKFNGKGTRMGIGSYAAYNKEMTDGVVFAGAVRCKYRKRR